jgi:hypothetical protein
MEFDSSIIIENSIFLGAIAFAVFNYRKNKKKLEEYELKLRQELNLIPMGEQSKLGGFGSQEWLYQGNHSSQNFYLLRQKKRVRTNNKNGHTKYVIHLLFLAKGKHPETLQSRIREGLEAIIPKESIVKLEKLEKRFQFEEIVEVGKFEDLFDGEPPQIPLQGQDVIRITLIKYPMPIEDIKKIIGEIKRLLF